MRTTLAISALLLLGVPARADQSSDDRFYESVKEAMDSGLVKGEEALRYRFYKLMAAANAAGNPDDRLPKLEITVSGDQIGGLQDIRYAAILPDSGSHGIVTTGDRRDAWFPEWPTRVPDGDRATRVEIPAMSASLCTKEYYRRGQAPFLGAYRCDERVPVVVWMEFGYATTLYFFSQDVMNACDAPEKEFPLDLRAYKIRGALVGTEIVAKARVSCERSKKKAKILIQTDPAWGRKEAL